MEKRLLNIQELCDYTGLGKTKIREILKRPSNSFTVKIGNRTYVDKEKFDAFLEQCMKYNIAI